MTKYKSVITDYEGLQAVLDSHAAQGWRLFSVSVDTWRKSADSNGIGNPPFGELSNGKPVPEYSASYYMVVFEREDYLESSERAIAAEESLPRHFFDS